MPRSTYRVLKRRGRATLVESVNPAEGVAYSVWLGGVGLWTGDNLAEAEKEFSRALCEGAH